VIPRDAQGIVKVSDISQCDRATPSCSQCIRAHRDCPGYRNEVDLMFRNESEAVIGKAKAREKNKAKSKSRSHSPAIASPSGSKEEPRSPSSEFSSLASIQEKDGGFFVETLAPKFSMFPTTEERALGYFNHNSTTWFRNFDVTEELCSQTTVDEHLLASMSAVGLASFSHSVHAPALMVRARREYVSALKLTNVALRSPTEAKKDTTLFSVMILGIFETVTGNSERSLAAWAEHMNGAAALVKLRGKDQFKTQAGLRMFLQVTSNLMLSCIQRTTAMPAHIIELRKEAGKYMEDQPAWKLSEIIIDFTIFRAAVRDVKLVGPREIVAAGLAIDRRFIEAFAALPEEWHYKVVYTDETPELIWNGNYHVYKENWMAHIWNGMRVCRIMLHETIRDQLLSASTAMTPIFTEYEIAAQNDSSMNAMLQMRADILASVPHHTPLAFSEKPISLLEGSRAYFVLWPLYLCGAMDVTTEPIRNWVIARLRAIGESVGIKQAFVVAEYLSQQKVIATWHTKPDPKLPIMEHAITMSNEGRIDEEED
jgi:hypothetical protein